jgi:hypothetical protein
LAYKVDYTGFIPDAIVWLSAYGEDGPLHPDEARRRMAQWDPERLKRAQRAPMPDEDPEEYQAWIDQVLGTVKRPAGWPKGKKERGELLRFAMEYVREAQRQLIAQGHPTWYLTRDSVDAALDHLKSIDWPVDQLKTSRVSKPKTRLEKALSQDR